MTRRARRFRAFLTVEKVTESQEAPHSGVPARA